MQRDLNDVLSDYPENAFDYVIFNLTIQMTKHAVRALDEALRIGRRVIASFPNFGYYANVLSFVLYGRMPKSKWLPFEWYDTPNIHLLTLNDFVAMCREREYRILKRFYYSEKRPVRILPNTFAPYCMFVVEKEG